MCFSIRFRSNVFADGTIYIYKILQKRVIKKYFGFVTSPFFALADFLNLVFLLELALAKTFDVPSCIKEQNI